MEKKTKKPKFGKFVRCIEDNMIFVSTQEAARYYGLSQSSVYGCCVGRLRSVYDYHFEFVKPTRELILELREETNSTI